MKKFATASALALLGLTAINAQAQTAVTESLPGVFSVSAGAADDISTGTSLVSNLLQRFAPESMLGSVSVTGPEIGVISGAINLARINGAIDISGTNVALSSMANNVSATATAVGSTSTAEAYAIAGAKLATTVIGAMNSATVDLAGRTSEATSNLGNSFGVNSLAAQDSSSLSLGVGDLAGGLPTAGGLATITASLGSATLFDVSGGSFDLAGLTNNATSALTAKVTDLQNIGVFNAAINVAALDAGIKVAAAVDTGAWFLNPQTGVVNLSNISMATTAIGAMNSSITKLGTTLAK